MSLSMTGVASSSFYRNSGGPTSSGTMTYTFWFKRKADFSGLKYIVNLVPNPENTGHGLVVNDSNFAAYTPSVQINWASTQIVADDPLPLDEWVFMSIQGSGSNLYLKYWDGDALVTEVNSQTAFAIANERWGDSGANTHNINGLLAHIRVWNAVLTDAELLAEKNSETVVRTSNLLSAHSLGGGDLSTALTGQSGTAYTGRSALAYSTDMPEIVTFLGTVISGEATMPSDSTVVPVEGARVNRLLWSADLTQSTWSRQGNELVTGAATPPGAQGAAQRVKLAASPVGGVYATVNNLPAGVHVAIMAVKRVDTDYVCFRHMTSDFGNGAQGHFDLVNGGWTFSTGFGVYSGTPTFGYRTLSNGWFLIWIAVNVAGSSRLVEFYPIATSGVQTPAPSKSLDVAGFQHEDGSIPHYHKPTMGAVTTRMLDSLTLTVANTTVPLGLFTASVTARDDAGAPWDDYEPVSIQSSDQTKLTFPASQATKTNLSGVLSWAVDAKATGTATLKGVSDELESPAVSITITETQQTERWVRIRTEPGWSGTTGWAVGVYEKHSTDRFPSTKLFERLSQQFRVDTWPVTNESFMDVAIPSGVVLTVGTEVEVVLENDNVNGVASDGPGIFSAVVI